MTIKVGDKLPKTTFYAMTSEGPQAKTTDEIFKGKKVALFGVPGAFTPTCSNLHMPSFVKNIDAIKGKGVNDVIVTAVNDAFVLREWLKSTGAEGKVEALSDGNAEFTKAAGLDMDGSGRGLGIRTKRFSMLVEDGVVKSLNIEDSPGQCTITGGDTLLKQL